MYQNTSCSFLYFYHFENAVIYGFYFLQSLYIVFCRNSSKKNLQYLVFLR